jgi:ligand-binding sensor domain-containing protein
MAIHGQWINYNSFNTKGLPGTMVSSVFEDNNNNFWFGTDQGLSCLNIKLGTWITYKSNSGLLNSFIYKVFGDKDGNIWATTNGGGVGRYSGNSWTNFTVKDGLSYDVVRAVCQSPEGTLWFGTYGHGICSYTTAKGFKKITAGPISGSYVLSMLALSDKKILIGTLNQGLLVYENDTVYTIQNESGTEGKRIYCVTRDHTGNIWIGTDQGARQYNPETRTLSPGLSAIDGKKIYSISENKEGNLVFASDDQLYCVTNGTWSDIIPNNMNSSTSFYVAYFDSDGSGWFGSSNQGLFKKTGTSWYNFFNSTGLSENYMQDICEDANHYIWFSSYSDLYRFDGTNWISVAKKAGITDAGFRQMVADQSGNIWCLTYYRGLCKYDGTSWTFYPTDKYFDNNYLQCICIDAKGNVWLGTGSSIIYRYNGTVFTRYSNDDGLTLSGISAITTGPDGWPVAISYYEVSRFNGTRWQTLNISSLDNAFYDVAVDRNNDIWLATYTGIIRSSDDEIVEYFKYEQTGQNYFNFINCDRNGLIWAYNAYNRGLIYYTGKDWVNFGKDSGLPEEYINNSLIDSRKRIWVLNYNGIYMLSNFTGINEQDPVPAEIISAYPNPFSSSFDMQYLSDKTGYAEICFYSADGKLVKQFSHQTIDAGVNILHFETTCWPEGLLMCKIQFQGSVQNYKLVKVSTR